MTGLLESKVNSHKNQYPPHVKVIPGSDMIYNSLLDASIVIVQGYSTTYLESLYLDKPTILCQIPKNHDYLDIDRFPDLPQSHDVDSLIQLLTLHKNDPKHKIAQTKYQTARIQYLKPYFDLPKAESLVERIDHDLQKLLLIP